MKVVSIVPLTKNQKIPRFWGIRAKQENTGQIFFVVPDGSSVEIHADWFWTFSYEVACMHLCERTIYADVYMKINEFSFNHFVRSDFILKFANFRRQQLTKMLNLRMKKSTMACMKMVTEILNFCSIKPKHRRGYNFFLFRK